MPTFLKQLLASCLGVLLALGVLILIGVGIVARLSDQASKPPKIAANTVLHLKFDKQIPERTNNLEMNPFDFSNQKILGLQDIVRTIRQAKTDDEIRGIFLELQGSTYGHATMHALHDVLVEFKESGKFIIAYGDYFEQGGYYLSAVADQVIVNPMGDFSFRGFAAIIPFFKNMLDKVGVKMQVFYAGQYKSATEPYRLSEMSDANRLQVREFMEDLFQNYLADIAQHRNIPFDELRSLSDNFKIQKVEDAAQYGLVDQLGYKDEAISWMRNKLGLEQSDELPMVELEAYYLASKEPTNFRINDKIAILYSEGNIIMGEGDPGTIGDQKYTKLIQDIREDDDIKAVVLRINSPGGSALASENIWRELQLLREAHKPLVVSMGDYAASGGYYIACLGDSILANANTLTGSIGVFNILPNARELLNDHLGITFDTVNTGSNSTGLTPFFDLAAADAEWLQTSVDSIYEHFLQRVGEGRGMTRDAVHEIAQGRVWTGQKAQQIGLVDQLGDLDDAIDIAAYLSGLEDYRLAEYPEIQDPLQAFVKELTGGEETGIQSQLLQQQLGAYYPYYQQLETLKQLKGYQALLPFFVLPN
ncbi:MAG: signal peptide peptidase SppA [Saprospiraceae bacterium]|nr:signal peptide peptidase SppA [Saprospiraceae bacterium]